MAEKNRKISLSGKMITYNTFSSDIGIYLLMRGKARQVCRMQIIILVD
jgi:hypothetical protein